MTTLRTARLVLRPWRESDRAPFAAMSADPAVMEHFPAVLRRDESDAFLDRVSADLDRRGWGLWAVEVGPGPGPEGGRFAGFTGLAEPRFDAHFTPAVEVGWRLARWAWGRGWATEAATAVLAHAFGPLALPEVVSFTAVTNVRSQAVMRRLGMSHDRRDDFDHPVLPAGHPLARQVLYRATPLLTARS